MFADLAMPLLLVIFVASAGAIWVSRTTLSRATDELCGRLGWGEALGGVVMLAIVTNLPELAITVSAAWTGSLDVAVGNILGGIAIQTVVLVWLDAAGGPGTPPLTSRTTSLSLVIEGLLVIAVLVVAIMGTQLPPSLTMARIEPASVLIALLWVGGVWLIGRASVGLSWQVTASVEAPRQPVDGESTAQPAGLARAGWSFVAAAIVTLVAGVLLERSGSALATQLGMSGVLFGATVLAAATALPEVSTGLAAVRMGDIELAVSDILGGNAFLPVLFLLATLVSGEAVLPHAQTTDVYLAALGILLTATYLTGLIVRPQRRVLGVGIDSLAVLVLYAVGMAGLVAIATHGVKA